jgi:hypothetical protein
VAQGTALKKHSVKFGCVNMAFNLNWKKNITAHTYNPSTLEAEEGRYKFSAT